MKKYKLHVTEKLEFERIVNVEVPDNINEDQLERYLNGAEGAGYDNGIDGFMHHLKAQGIVIEPYHDDYACPDTVEIECEGYDEPDETD